MNQMYRFYVNNPIRFQKLIRVTVEHGHAHNFENDYGSTAFWYQKDPHKAFPSMPSVLACQLAPKLSREMERRLRVVFWSLQP